MIRPELRPVNWQAELEPGEALLWHGGATPALATVAPQQAEWLIGGLGAVTVAMLAIARFNLSFGDGAALAGLVALIAALFAAGYPLRQMHQRARRLRLRQYALTDRRVLVADGKPRQITRARRATAAPQMQIAPGAQLGTLVVPLHHGEPARLPHIAHPQAVLKVILALGTPSDKGRTA